MVKIRYNVFGNGTSTPAHRLLSTGDPQTGNRAMNTRRSAIGWSVGVSVVVLLSRLTGPVWANETPQPPAMKKTQLVLKLGTNDLVPIQARFERTPPTIVLEFPAGRVAGTLPEQSLIQRGVLQAIRAVYASSKPTGGIRWIKALRIVLTAPYHYTVSAEPGQILVEIDHPATVAGNAIEMGLSGGVLVLGAAPASVSERFRAMDDALAQARPVSLSWTGSPGPTDALKRVEQGDVVGTSRYPLAQPARASTAASQAHRLGMLFHTRNVFARWLWLMIGLWAAATAVVLARWAWRSRLVAIKPREDSNRPAVQIPASLHLVDQLVWRVFERQGYELLHLGPLNTPLGLMRVIAKEGRKAVLCSLGDGTFFEKATVEQFLKLVQDAQATEGFLVTAGSFTVPAQRLAKEHQLSLIGREQLADLLAEGAMSESSNRQLQQLHAKLDEAKEILEQYGRQLETLRRQRNEASWSLGEERAKTAKLRAQLEEANQQLLAWKSQTEDANAAASSAHTQWEESQWYLGEAHAAIQRLEEELRASQETHALVEERLGQAMANLQEADRQRDEANWYLGESRALGSALQQQIRELDERTATLTGELEAIRQAREDAQRQLEDERGLRLVADAQLAAIRAYGERRRVSRMFYADATVELQHADGQAVFQGAPRDLSEGGFGIDAPDGLDLPESLRVRLSHPGFAQPLETTGRRVWRHPEPTNRRQAFGFQFDGLSPDSRKILEQLCRTLQAASPSTPS